jgi:hypothetical protein
MVRFRASAISLALLFSFAIAQPTPATAASQITTCTDLKTGKSLVLQAPRKDCRPFQGTTIWNLASDISAPVNSAYLTVCTSKRAQFSYQIIKSKCAKYQNTNEYIREVKVPKAPVIEAVSARNNDGVVITLDLSHDEKLSSPISYYLVTNLSTGIIEKYIAGNQNIIYVAGLQAQTSYSFKVVAVNVDGPSLPSGESSHVNTLSLPQQQTTQSFVSRYAVGDLGPGGGIIFYIAAQPFTSSGSSCDAQCHYLEVAPSTWQHGVIEEDLTYAWSTNTSVATEQDRTTPSTEGRVSERTLEKANWRIGAGLNNTRVMKVAGAQSDAQAAVLAYGGHDLSVGQWFIPSLNEINELCKFVRGQSSGDPSVACTNAGGINSSTTLNPAAGGFGEAIYWTSSERDASRAWLFNLRGGRGRSSQPSSSIFKFARFERSKEQRFFL